MVAAGITLVMAGCAGDPRLSRGTEYLGPGGRVIRDGRPVGAPRYDTVSYWDGDGVGGSPSIIIRLEEQRAYFYKGGQLVGVSTVSTGREGYNTPTGRFKVIQKEKDHRSTLYGDFVDGAGNVVVRDVSSKEDRPPPGTHFQGSSMPFFMRVHGATGMHAGFLPGFAASHGCIRMPDFMAENFFANAPAGTPVTITY